MKMLQCENNHYYDNSIYPYCPYCSHIKPDEPPHNNSALITISEWVGDQSYIEDNESIATPQNQLKDGDLFGRYIIEYKIASGGFSSVYKVKHKHLQHNYALKVFENNSELKINALDLQTLNIIVNGKIDTQELRELFLKEANNLVIMKHKNVVKVFDVGVINNYAYILLEYIESERLDKVLLAVDQFTVDKTIDLLEDIASVLVKQEKHGIIHGDIKPQNIFLRENNTFCLIDYGNMNSDNIISYTQEYASPEHHKKTLNNQSDLFQLGLVAWECLSGTKMNATKENFKLPPIKKRQDIPTELFKILTSLLHLEITDRYQKASDLLYDISAYKYNNESPIGAVRGSIFIAISYESSFKDTYEAINKTAKKLQYKCIRMDKLDFREEIWKNISLEIEYSDIVIADFTNQNPNVITEASHARAIGKYIIIITQEKPEKLPFDWRYIPAIQYAPTTNGLKKLSKEIYDKLRTFSR